MNQNLDELVRELNEIAEYQRLFKKVFGQEGITAANIGKALATFERTIISANSPFDKYLAGDREAMSPSAVNGMKLFAGKAGCNLCHNGPNFTDNGFHNIGVKPGGPLENDPGRYAISKDTDDAGAFKTPTLRHITRTAPYMHNGTEKTLKDVVDLYDRGGDARKNLSPLIHPLSLSAREKQDLIEFLKALEGDEIVISVPILP